MTHTLPPRWAFEIVEQEKARYVEAAPNPANVDIIMADPVGWMNYHIFAAYVARTARPPCQYCGDGKITGLPGNACENCLNTGFADACAADLAPDPTERHPMIDAFKARTADALDAGTIPAAVHRELELLWRYLTEAFPPVPAVGAQVPAHFAQGALTQLVMNHTKDTNISEINRLVNEVRSQLWGADPVENLARALYEISPVVEETADLDGRVICPAAAVAWTQLDDHDPRIRESRRQQARAIVSGEDQQPYRDELEKIAESLGDGTDPFAAWETLAFMGLWIKKAVEALTPLAHVAAIRPPKKRLNGDEIYTVVSVDGEAVLTYSNCDLAAALVREAPEVQS